MDEERYREVMHELFMRYCEGRRSCADKNCKNPCPAYWEGSKGGRCLIMRV
jgi:hypothetical protein